MSRVIENGHRGNGAEKVSVDSLKTEVIDTLGKMQRMGIPDGAPIGKIHGIFQSPETVVKEISGREAKKWGTASLSRRLTIEIAVASKHKNIVGNKSFRKDLDTAVKDGMKEYDEQTQEIKPKDKQVVVYRR